MAAGENNDSWPIRFGVTVADVGVEAGVAVSGSAKSGREVSSAPASAAAAKIRFVRMWDTSLCSSWKSPSSGQRAVIEA
jgi:hypothetical protein